MKLKFIKFLDVAIEYLNYGVIFYIPISIAIISILGYMAIMLFFLKQFLSPDFSSIKSNKVFFLILLIFYICMALSLLNSGPFIAKGLKALFLKWGRFPFILWMILDTFRDPKRFVKVAGVLLFGGSLVGLSAFSQKFLGLEFLRHQPSLVSGIITGPFVSHDDLAAYLICISPLALSFSLRKWERISVKTGYIVTAVMLMICSFLTYSRGGWIGLSTGLILIALLINYKRIPKKIFWPLFSLSYFLVVPLIAIGVYLLRKDVQRIALYQGAWKMITEHPFLGKGLGTFMDYCVQYTHNPWPCYAHNCFLQIWAESGTFSLLSFLLLNGYIIYKLIKTIISTPKTLNYYILLGIGAGYLSLLVHCFFDTQLYSFQLSYLFWVVLGLVVALSSKLSISKENA